MKARARSPYELVPNISQYIIQYPISSEQIFTEFMRLMNLRHFAWLSLQKSFVFVFSFFFFFFFNKSQYLENLLGDFLPQMVNIKIEGNPELSKNRFEITNRENVQWLKKFFRFFIVRFHWVLGVLKCG